MTGSNWIGDALRKKSSKGALHRELGVPVGKDIPKKKLAKAAKSKSPKIRRQVELAKTLESFNK